MEKELGVMNTDHDQLEILYTLLSDQQYKVASLNSLSDMESYLEQHNGGVVILDLDTVAIDNRILRNLKRKDPLVTIIALSERHHHPELEEALRNYISVCLVKPIDPDELFYWLRCVFNNDEETEV